MLELLSDQIENYFTGNKKRQQYKNTLNVMMKLIFILLKETYYPHNHVFLDIEDNVNDTYIVDFVGEC